MLFSCTSSSHRGGYSESTNTDLERPKDHAANPAFYSASARLDLNEALQRLSEVSVPS